MCRSEQQGDRLLDLPVPEELEPAGNKTLDGHVGEVRHAAGMSCRSGRLGSSNGRCSRVLYSNHVGQRSPASSTSRRGHLHVDVPERQERQERLDSNREVGHRRPEEGRVRSNPEHGVMPEG
jgi:hypothetical protein